MNVNFRESLLIWAEHYTRCGMYLIPLPYKQKRPAMEAWPVRASKNYDTVASWIRNGYPQKSSGEKHLETGGLGIVTGESSGIIVLDVDGAQGMETLTVLEKQYGKLPETPTQQTPGGGVHMFFKYWGGCKNHVGILSKLGLNGLDIRGDSGQAVAAPSIHPNGKPYKWSAERGLDDIEIAECPFWLKTLIESKTPYLKSAFDIAGESIPESRRNQTLTSIAGTMRKRNMSERAILAALLEVNQEQCKPPLPDAEVKTIAHSIGHKPAGNNTQRNAQELRFSIEDAFTDVEGDPVHIEHIGDIFPRGDVSVFFGRAGCGKTIFLDCFTRQLSVGGSILDGCLQREEPPRRVIFFEADANIKLFATRKHVFRWGGDKTRLKHVFSRDLLMKRNYFLDLGTEQGLMFARAVAEKTQPDIIIFDTLQGFHLLDENKADEMKFLFLKLVKLATDHDCAIVVTHHARKGNPKNRHERLSIEDAQGSNIFLREAGAVIALEKLNVGDKTLHVFSRMKSWIKPTQDDWFGFQIIEEGFYEKYLKLAFELFPGTGANRSEALRRSILGREGWFTRGDIIAAHPSISESLIKKILTELTEACLLEVNGEKRWARYRVQRSD